MFGGYAMSDFWLMMVCLILVAMIAGMFILAWIGDRVIEDEHEDINNSI